MGINKDKEDISKERITQDTLESSLNRTSNTLPVPPSLNLKDKHHLKFILKIVKRKRTCVPGEVTPKLYSTQKSEEDLTETLNESVYCNPLTLTHVKDSNPEFLEDRR